MKITTHPAMCYSRMLMVKVSVVLIKLCNLAAPAPQYILEISLGHLTSWSGGLPLQQFGGDTTRSGSRILLPHPVLSLLCVCGEFAVVCS